MEHIQIVRHHHSLPLRDPCALPRASRGHNVVATYIFLMLAVDGLGAYSLLGIPVPWFAYCIAVGALIHLSRFSRVMLPGGSVFLVMLIAYAGFVHAVSVLRGEEYFLPARMTTPYALFIASRFAVLVGSLLVSALIYTTAMRFGTSVIIYTTLAAMAFLAVAAIALYAAQVFGYWEPPRNRMGTGGQDYLSDAMTFQYEFHRAAGTFREPSHLAQWIAAPLLLLFVSRGQIATVLWGIVGCVLVLSGSLLGVLGLLVGLACVGVFLKRAIAWRMLLLTLVGSGTLCGLASFMSIDFWGTMSQRLLALIQGGAEATNRAYVYEYLRTEAPPPLGFGLGNANLAFSEYLRNDLVSSHISLFVNIWFSLGAIGLALMLLYVTYPILCGRVWRSAAKGTLGCVLFAGIVTWLVMYLGNAEELTVVFGVFYGLVWANVDADCRSRREASGLRCKSEKPGAIRRSRRIAGMASA